MERVGVSIGLSAITDAYLSFGSSHPGLCLQRCCMMVGDWTVKVWVLLLHSHQLVPGPDVGHGGVPDPRAARQVVLACPDQLQQHVAALGHLGETVGQVLAGVDVADLLDGLLLLDALPQLDDVGV
jgi:hypothetical protein